MTDLATNSQPGSAAPPKPTGPLTLDQLLKAITAADVHFDAEMSEQYQQQPLARTWARVTTGASVAGKVIDALSAWTGENFRKGVCGTREDLLGKLADGVVTLLCATQHVTKDQDMTWAVASAAARKVCRRIAQQQAPGDQPAAPGLLPPDGSFTLAQLLEAVAAIDAHIDAGMSEQYQQQPLARTWARVTKGASEAAEAIDALSAWTGANFREGACGTRKELLGELADSVMALLGAIQHVTKDQAVTWAAVSAATCRLLRRIARHRSAAPQPPGGTGAVPSSAAPLPALTEACQAGCTEGLVPDPRWLAYYAARRAARQQWEAAHPRGDWYESDEFRSLKASQPDGPEEYSCRPCGGTGQAPTPAGRQILDLIRYHGPEA